MAGGHTNSDLVFNTARYNDIYLQQSASVKEGED